jgi:GT2 family glycosyltransferase
MLSVILPVRNSRAFATNALISLKATFEALGSPNDVEFILIDDFSDPQDNIPALLRDFRTAIKADVKIFRFKQRGYYTYACSLGFSRSRGDMMLFISHDMICTPRYVRMLVDVAKADASFGVVRGCSPHVDCFPEHVYHPPFPLRNFEDVVNFSEYVASYFKNVVQEDRFLIGDSFLLKRSVVEKIGVMDTKFVHLFGDMDFGLRARRAGFKLVCAKGAWLHHEGSGHTKDQQASGRATPTQLGQTAQKLLGDAYAYFREKWGSIIPDRYTAANEIDFDRLCQLPPIPGGEFVPLLAHDSNFVEEL